VEKRGVGGEVRWGEGRCNQRIAERCVNKVNRTVGTIIITPGQT